MVLTILVIVAPFHYPTGLELTKIARFEKPWNRYKIFNGEHCSPVVHLVQHSQRSSFHIRSVTVSDSIAGGYQAFLELEFTCNLVNKTRRPQHKPLSSVMQTTQDGYHTRHLPTTRLDTPAPATPFCPLSPANTTAPEVYKQAPATSVVHVQHAAQQKGMGMPTSAQTQAHRQVCCDVLMMEMAVNYLLPSRSEGTTRACRRRCCACYVTKVLRRRLTTTRTMLRARPGIGS